MEGAGFFIRQFVCRPSDHGCSVADRIRQAVNEITDTIVVNKIVPGNDPALSER